MKVLVSEQIFAKLRTLHPDHRKLVRKAIQGLANEKGDRKQLVGALSDYYRLRIGRYRVVYCYREKHIEAVFLEVRSIVYELFRP